MVVLLIIGLRNMFFFLGLLVLSFFMVVISLCLSVLYMFIWV